MIPTARQRTTIARINSEALSRVMLYSGSNSKGSQQEVQDVAVETWMERLRRKRREVHGERMTCTHSGHRQAATAALAHGQSARVNIGAAGSPASAISQPANTASR